MAHLKVLQVSSELIVSLLHGGDHSHQYEVTADPMPEDAQVRHVFINSVGTVSLVVESASFPFVPDGLPFDQLPAMIPVLTNQAAK